MNLGYDHWRYVRNIIELCRAPISHSYVQRRGLYCHRLRLAGIAT